MVIKIDVPISATPKTPWKLTKLAKTPYFSRVLDTPTPNAKISDGRTEIRITQHTLEEDSDIYAVAVDNLVSITPLSTDITSRVKFETLTKILNGGHP